MLPLLRQTEAKGGKPRIVQVNSALAYEHDSFDLSQAVRVSTEEDRACYLTKPYSMFHAYGQSKLASMMCLKELSRQLVESGSNIPVNAIHPGEISSDVTRDMPT